MIRSDLETSEGLAAALRSPAQSVRYLAWTKLHEQGHAALQALMSMWKQDDPIRSRNFRGTRGSPAIPGPVGPLSCLDETPRAGTRCASGAHEHVEAG